MRKKNQTVTATEETVIDYIESDVCLFIATLRQLGGDKKLEHEQAMRMLEAKFGDSIGDELMAKVSKALEEHGIVDTEKKEQEVKEEVKDMEVKKEVKEKKQAKWAFSKATKIDTFERMLEKAWADSGLKDESIKNEVRDKLAQWYRLDSASPLAGYDKHHRPQSQEELEMDMYENIDMQFSQYDGYREDMDMEQIMMEHDMEQIVKDEKLEKAEWEYYEDQTEDAPRAEATATIDGYEVTVGYLWDEQEGGCHVHVNGFAVRDKGVCDHCCEVVGKAIGKELTGLSYELWESWVEYHERYEDWEDMDEDERHELYSKAIVSC